MKNEETKSNLFRKHPCIVQFLEIFVGRINARNDTGDYVSFERGHAGNKNYFLSVPSLRARL